MITIDQAARILGISSKRVGQLIRAGRLPAQKFGDKPNSPYILSEAEVRQFARQKRKSGRPVTTGTGKNRKDRRID